MWARMRGVDKDEDKDVGKNAQRGRGWGGGRQQVCVVWAETCDKDRNVGKSALMIWATVRTHARIQARVWSSAECGRVKKARMGCRRCGPTRQTVLM
jgi:hypothetical protein